MEIILDKMNYYEFVAPVPNSEDLAGQRRTGDPTFISRIREDRMVRGTP
jgi:hypothetical protein